VYGVVPTGTGLVYVASDRILVAAEGPSGAEGGGDLSPDGDHWFTSDVDDHDGFAVFDSGTGHWRTPSSPVGRVTPYAWVDNDTIAAWTLPTYHAGEPVTLLTCRVSTSACSVAARDIGTFGHISLDGQPVD
jgi:hypothetical protein